MVDIEFSHMGSVAALGLANFESKTRIRVKLRDMAWDTAWNMLLQIALHNQGPDISQIGNTWLGSLSGMNTLRPFSQSEIRQLGGQGSFIPSAWQSSSLPDEEQGLAIPWQTDTRLICYRRDLLAKAGIEEQTAFKSTESLLDTLERLQGSSIEGPLVMSTIEEVLHFLASWIWGAEGDFRTSDYLHLSIQEPQAVRGILDFYKLYRYFKPRARNLNIWDADSLFLQGQAAVVITGFWIKSELRNHANVSPEVMENMGVVMVPGVPFVGGSSLVIWRYTFQEKAALELVHHLVSPQTQGESFKIAGLLPSRMEVISSAPFTTDPFYQVVADSLKAGRAFQSSNRWAAVEVRLTAFFNQLWTDLFNLPDANVEEMIPQRVMDITTKIDRSLLA